MSILVSTFYEVEGESPQDAIARHITTEQAVQNQRTLQWAILEGYAIAPGYVINKSFEVLEVRAFRENELLQYEVTLGV